MTALEGVALAAVRRPPLPILVRWLLFLCLSLLVSVGLVFPDFLMFSGFSFVPVTGTAVARPRRGPSALLGAPSTHGPFRPMAMVGQGLVQTAMPAWSMTDCGWAPQQCQARLLPGWGCVFHWFSPRLAASVFGEVVSLDGWLWCSFPDLWSFDCLAISKQFPVIFQFLTFLHVPRFGKFQKLRFTMPGHVFEPWDWGWFPWIRHRSSILLEMWGAAGETHQQRLAFLGSGQSHHWVVQKSCGRTVLERRPVLHFSISHMM